MTALIGVAKPITLTGADSNTRVLPITYAVSAPPPHGTLSGTIPNLMYTPAAGYFGSDSFQFKTNNGLLDNALATVSVTVYKEPSATGQLVGAMQGTPQAVTLVGSDPNLPALPLTYIVTAAPGHGATSGSGAALTYTPAAGYFGPDSFKFKTNNGLLDSTAATVSLIVYAKPLAQNQSQSLNQNTPLSLILAGSDPDSPPLSLTYSVTTQPAFGLLSGAAPNIVYTPNAGYFGTDSFQFKTNNGYLDSDAATVSLKIYGKPTAFAQSIETNVNTDVVPNGTDGNIPLLPLTSVITALPAHGTLNGTGTYRSYTPNANYVGSDSVSFKVNNTHLDSDVAISSIYVVGRPTAASQSVIAKQGVASDFTLSGTDPNTPRASAHVYHGSPGAWSDLRQWRNVEIHACSRLFWSR